METEGTSPSQHKNMQSEVHLGSDHFCRICRCSSTPDSPLFHPCLCTGSIKYVHEACLLDWLSHINSKSKSKCELCGHHFGFTRIYSKNAPERLPLKELLSIAAHKLLSLLPFLSRISLAFFAWVVFVPVVTSLCFNWLSLSGNLDLLMYSFSDIQQSGDSNSVKFGGFNFSLSQFGVSFEGNSSGFRNGSFVNRSLFLLKTGNHYIFWYTGVVITWIIIGSFLALLVVFDYVHGWNDIRRLEALDESSSENTNNEVVENTTNAEENPSTAIPSDNQEPSNTEDNSSSNSTRILLSDTPQMEQPRREDLVQNNSSQQRDNEKPVSNLIETEQTEISSILNEESSGNGNVPLATDSEVSSDNILPNELRNVESSQQYGPTSAESNQAEVVDSDDDFDFAANGDLNNFNEEEVVEINLALDEFIGLRGSILLLIHNVVCLIVFNFIFLCAVFYFPTSLGSLIITTLNNAAEAVAQVTFLKNTDESFLLRSYERKGLRKNFREMKSNVLNMTDSVLEFTDVEPNKRDCKGDNTSLGNDVVFFFNNDFAQLCSVDVYEGGDQINSARIDFRKKAVDFECFHCINPDLSIMSSISEDHDISLYTHKTISSSSFNARKVQIFQEDAVWVNVRHNLLELSAFGVGHLTLALSLALLLWFLRNLRIRAKVIKKTISLLQTTVNTFKIAILIVLKMVAVPILLGLWLDYNLLPLLERESTGFPTGDRPLLTLLRLWVFGITHMLVITILLIQARDIFHRDILGHIIRPHDPNANFMQMLLSESVVQHLRRMVISVVIYSLIIFLFTLVPIKFAFYAASLANCGERNDVTSFKFKLVNFNEDMLTLKPIDYQELFLCHDAFVNNTEFALDANFDFVIAVESLTSNSGIGSLRRIKPEAKVEPATLKSDECFLCSRLQAPSSKIETYSSLMNKAELFLIYETVTNVKDARPTLGTKHFKRLLRHHFKFDYIFTDFQIPFELVIYHLIVLHVLERYKYQIFHFQKRLVEYHIDLFMLRRYLLPCPVVDGENLYTPDCNFKETALLLNREKPNHLITRLTLFMLCWYGTSMVVLVSFVVAPLLLSEFFISRLGLDIVHFPHKCVLGAVIAIQLLDLFHKGDPAEIVQRLRNAQNKRKFMMKILAFVSLFVVTVFTLSLMIDLYVYPSESRRFAYLSKCYVESMIQSPSNNTTVSLDLLHLFSNSTDPLSYFGTYISQLLVGIFSDDLINRESLQIDALVSSWLKGLLVIFGIHLLLSNDLPWSGGRLKELQRKYRSAIQDARELKLENLSLFYGGISLGAVGVVFTSFCMVNIYELYLRPWLQLDTTCIITSNGGIENFRTALIFSQVLFALSPLHRVWKQGFMHVHDFLRDEKYLVGRKLLNFYKSRTQ